MFEVPSMVTRAEVSTTDAVPAACGAVPRATAAAAATVSITSRMRVLFLAAGSCGRATSLKGNRRAAAGDAETGVIARWRSRPAATHRGFFRGVRIISRRHGQGDGELATFGRKRPHIRTARLLRFERHRDRTARSEEDKTS